VKGSLATVDKYIELGMDAAKMNLGFALYAKFFETKGQCSQPIGCETVLLEDETGADTGKSGAVTFQEGVSVQSQGIADDEEGGMWFWESSTNKFWTWDSPTYIQQKFDQIIKARGLGGASKFDHYFYPHLCCLHRDWTSTDS
jgi:chitinase